MRALVLLLAAATILSACDGTPAISKDAGPATTPEGGRPQGSEDHNSQRTARIYAAVVRRLVNEDHTFGEEPSPFERVFVVDGVAERAGDPVGGRHVPSKPFTAEVKAGMVRELGDLPPVHFVRDPASVVATNRGCAYVQGNGALITLGPISKGTAETVTVANGLFFACLGGQWLTYVLKPVGSSWRVVGTTGPVAIS
jgi:hypothetical protein